MRIKNHLLLLLLFCFCQKNLLSQNETQKNIDSLIRILKTAKEDTSKVNILNLLSGKFINIGEYEKAKQYGDAALMLATKLGFKKAEAISYNIIGRVNNFKGNYDEALKQHSIALKIWEELRDKSGVKEELVNKRGIADTYQNIGNNYFKQGDYPEALKNYFASLKINEEIGNKQGIAVCNASLGIVYKDQGKYPEALKNYFAALKVFESLLNKKNIAITNHNIGLVYELQGNYTEALKRFYSALTIEQEVGDKVGIARSYINLANIYSHQNNYQEALKNHFAALKIDEEIGSKEDIALGYYNIGETYLNQKKYTEALQNELTSLKIYKELDSKVDVADVYEIIGNISEEQRNYEDAIKNYRASLKIYEEAGHSLGIVNSNIDIGNSLLSLAALKTRQAAKIKYDKALQYLNKGLKLAKDIGMKESEGKAYERIADAYKGLNDYKKAMEYHNLYVEMKDSLLNNETTRKLEQQRTQYEVEKAVEEEKMKNENALTQQRAEQKRKNELLLAGFVILAVISFFIILLIRQRNQKRRAVEKAEAGHKMAELELQSLRAQLNPHFMFNSLNAIQDLILKEDNDKSHLYLSRFAKLLRLLLDNANQPFVSVKQELEFLELYLSLENLRIPNLQFTIEKDPNINMDERMVPNMMLQPYIENAIWHGLSNKKGERKLQVRIHENGTATEFEIEDNGIGRKKAAEIKELYRKGHHSKGMELLSKRFNLLSKEYGEAIHTSVTDLENNGNAAGTLVKIDVPFTLSEQTNQLTNDTNHYN